MKLQKRLLSLALLLALLLSCAPGAAADYTYKSRIFTGNQGTINGADMVDNAVSFDEADVTVSSETYCVLGIRESGKGDAKLYTYLPTKIDHDTDYVVVYGLKDEAVTLTIRYEDANGHQLLPPRTYYGNVGDKPQVQAAYKEDYTPSKPYITGTLNGDATWTFVYNKNVTANAANNAANNNVVNNNAANNNAANTPANTPTVEAQTTPDQEEILDLDIPQGAIEDGSTPSPAQTAAPAKRPGAAKTVVILTSILLLGLLGALYWYLLFYRKQKRTEKETGSDEIHH